MTASLSPRRSEQDPAAAELDRVRVLYSHALNSRNSILALARMCTFRLRDDFTIGAMTNTRSILGPLSLDMPAADALGSDSARAYFQAMRRLGHMLDNAAEQTEDQPWNAVFPDSSSASPADIFGDWTSVPPGGWALEGNGPVLLTNVPPNSEHYLVSSRELIGERDDFRIEYAARADGPPMDLSLVVGTAIEPDVLGVFGARPETLGYTFAFGAMENRSTEIQRRLETVCATPHVRIEPGQTHHCVAERIGGLLRFSVDGHVACETVDRLPLVGAGQGYLALYSCGPRHQFSQLSVSVRPTCLTPETLAQIETLRAAVVETSGPADRVEVHYLGKNIFLFRPVGPA